MATETTTTKAKSEIPSFNSASIVEALRASNTDMKVKDIQAFVSSMRSVATEQLSNGVEFGIAGFGAFSFQVQAPRSGKTPNGVVFNSSAKNRAVFTASKDFKEQVAQTTGTIVRLSSDASADTDSDSDSDSE